MKLIASTDEVFAQYKAQLLSECRDLAPFYLPANAHYFGCYFESLTADESFVVELGKQPLLLVLICQAKEAEHSFFGHPVRLVWQQDIGKTAKAGANKVALKRLKQLTDGAKVKYIESATGALSEFAQMLLKQGYQICTQFNQQVDLCQSEQQLFSDIRKVFRANIRWGQEHLEYRLIDQRNVQSGDIEAFRQLHIKVAGCETRSKASWDLQESIIAAGEAFAIYGYLDGELVSTGLFLHSESQCYYSVGAYDRELFDKPISHALVWQGMTEAKRLGCVSFVFGEAFFTALERPGGGKATDKELAISHFKFGFGGELLPELVFSKN